jgi:hypothetical protein
MHEDEQRQARAPPGVYRGSTGTPLVRRRAGTVPCMTDDDIAREIQRQAREQIDRTIEIPDGLTEDEAVASVIEQYKAETGIALPKVDVRAEVREKMSGRDTT